MFRIIFYCDDSGGNCILEFLKSLPERARFKVAAYIRYLETYGNKGRRPYVGILRNKIYELRPGIGRLEPRILFFFDNRDIILARGFLKKTKEVPPEEIERAIKIMNDYKTKQI